MAVPTTSVEFVTAAFFDLDNTVVRGSSLFPFAWALVREGRIGVGELARFGLMNARFVRTRTESIHDRDAVVAKALALVDGQRVEDVTELCDRIVPGIVRTRTNLAVVSEIRRHRADGHQTWLVTASPVELAEAMAARLGMTGALGTQAESVDGTYTGRLTGDVLHGSHKADALAALAVVEGLDPMRCSAYSDSINDLPMLSMMGSSTVVNPNKQLRSIAVRRGWRVIDRPSAIDPTNRPTPDPLPAAAGPRR